MAEFGCLYSEVLLTRNAWEKRKLGELMKVTSVKRVHQSDWRQEGVPFLRARDIVAINKNQKVKEPIYISRDLYERYSEQSGRVTPGDLLVTGVGSIGIPFLIKTESPIYFKDGNIIWFQNRTLDPAFFYFQFTGNSIQTYILSTSGKGTVGTFTIATGKQTPIVFPKKTEQKLIGSTMSDLDNLIAATQHKIDALEQAKKALLQRLFDQSWRFKGYSDPWEKRKLGELAEFINGRAYKQDELLASGKYSVLRVGNFYTNDKWYYSNLELPEKYYAEEGDLLYTWSATFGPHIWIGPKVIYHYHIWKVALKNIFEKDFALQFFEADRVRLLNSTNGSTMIHVTKKDMESKGILLPDVCEQRTIGDLLKRVDHLIAATQSRLSSLELLKKALLQDLFI